MVGKIFVTIIITLTGTLGTENTLIFIKSPGENSGGFLRTFEDLVMIHFHAVQTRTVFIL